MQRFIQIATLFAFFVLMYPSNTSAVMMVLPSDVMVVEDSSSGTLSAKELRKQQRQERRIERRVARAQRLLAAAESDSMNFIAKLGFIFALVGIGGILFAFIPYLSIISGLLITVGAIAGLVLSIIALSNKDELTGKGNTQAIAGLVISITTIVLIVGAVILLVLAFA